MPWRERSVVEERVQWVKNAYDADATKVTLAFRDAYEPLGILEIADNGHGMSRDDIMNAFMRLSTDEKLRNPTDLPPENRTI